MVWGGYNMLDIEHWELCKKYPEYLVSDKGNVYSLKREKLLNPTNRDFYPEVCICINKSQRSVAVHRLVSEAFIPNPENKPQVNHKDGNKHNNNVTNLEWVTCKENINHAWKNNLSKVSHKSRNAGEHGTNVRLSWDDVHYIRQHYKRGINQFNKGNGTELCKKFNITESHLSHIITGLIWKE